MHVDPTWLLGELAEHGALGFRNVRFEDPTAFLNFAEVLGQPVEVRGGSSVQLYIANGRTSPPPAAPPKLRGSDLWHSDNSYKASPAAYTLLYLIDGAHGTSTELCDAQQAFETLSASMRQHLLAESYMALHDCTHDAGMHRARGGGADDAGVQGGTATRSDDANGGAKGKGLGSHGGTGGDGGSIATAMHPLLRAHPLTGKIALYISPLYTSRLLRTPTASDILTSLAVYDSDSFLLRQLFSHLVSPSGGGRTIFEWRAPGDLLLIDNARMLHRAKTHAMPSGCRRRMLRISIAGSPPFGPPSSPTPARRRALSTVTRPPRDGTATKAAAAPPAPSASLGRGAEARAVAALLLVALDGALSPNQLHRMVVAHPSLVRCERGALTESVDFLTDTDAGWASVRPMRPRCFTRSLRYSPHRARG